MKEQSSSEGLRKNGNDLMTKTRCLYCGAESTSVVVFCWRCGGSFQQESPQERLLYRLQLICQLIRNGSWDGFLVVASIKKQIEAAANLMEQHTDLRQECRESLAWLTRDLEAAESLVYNPAWLTITSVCLQLLEAVDCSALRARMTVLQKYANELLAGEKILAEGKRPSPEKLQVWLRAINEQASVSWEHAVRGIAATSQHWPWLAAALTRNASGDVQLLQAVTQAKAALREKNYGAAQKHFEATLTADPSHVKALEGMARVCVRLQEQERAIRYYRRAAELGTSDAMTYNNLAWYLSTTTETTEADRKVALWAARRAVEVTPVAICLDTLAEVLFQQGDVPGAIAATRAAIRDDPERKAYRHRMETLCAALPVPGSVDEVDSGKSQSEDFDVELGGDDMLGLGEGADTETPTEAKTDDDFLLTPLEECGEWEESESGPQVIALDTEGEGDDTETPTEAKTDDDFLLTPLEECGEEEDSESGPRVIGSAIEGEGDEATNMVGEAGQDVPVHGPDTEAGRRSERREGEVLAPVTNQVQFSVTAPAVMVAAEWHVIDVWAHLAQHRDEVLQLAREAQGGKEIRVKSKLGVRIARGTPLSVQLNIRGLVVEDSEQMMVWEGETANTTFPVRVPPEAKIGTYPGTVVIHVEQVPLAKIHFVVTVGREESSQLQQSPPTQRYRSAFASYASNDRDAVLGRLQGIQKALPDLDVFLDVASLRSGQRWYKQLVEEIAARDVFYLFWSAAAAKSSHVEREWRTALERKGIRFIDPVPLVSPEVVPPPPELADELHFNDWVLAYMRDTRR